MGGSFLIFIVEIYQRTDKKENYYIAQLFDFDI